MHGEPTDGAERRDLRKEDRAHVIDKHEYASRKFQGVSAENARIAVVLFHHMYELYCCARGLSNDCGAGGARTASAARHAPEILRKA